ncbi:MAG: RluA family pseudouridine synthase, partial [Bdellovibrionota bacterium]
EDKHLVVVSKPAGLLSQGEKTGGANLVDWAREYFGRNYVGLVHRLDRNTSGVMIIAKRSKSAERLSEALSDGKLERWYLAWVHGTLTQPQTWTHFLLKNEKTNTVRIVNNANSGKKAVLTANPIARGAFEGNALTLIEFKLETGRSHQIRVQSAHEGFSLLGDVKYGKPLQKSSFSRPALHSYRIRFPHPMTNEILVFEDFVPADFSNIKKI